MAFPDVTGLLDDFNRANGALGASWSAVGAHASGAISSNRLVFSADDSASAYNGVRCTDGVVFATAAAMSSGTSGGLIWRADAAGNGYCWYRAGTYNLVFRLDNDAAVGASFTQAWAAGDLMGVKFVGDTFELYRYSGGAWTLLQTRRDSTHTAPGWIGLYGDDSGSNQWDDFSGGSLDAAPETDSRYVCVSGAWLPATAKVCDGGLWIDAAGEAAVVGDGSFLGFATAGAPADWRPYDAASPFNQPLAESPTVHPQSADIVTNVMAFGSPKPGNLTTEAEASKDYGHPIYFAKPDDPVLEVDVGSYAIDGHRIPVPAVARAAGGSDGHVCVVTPDGWAYEFWQVSQIGSGTLRAAIGARQRYDGLGIVTPSMKVADRTIGGTTASYFGHHAGLIRGPELEAGRIDHALFVVVQTGAVDTSFGYGTLRPGANGAGGNGSTVYPSFKGDAINANPALVLPPMGARFFLDMTPEEIAATTAPRWEKTIATAMATYGAYMGDTGGPGFAFMFESPLMYSSYGRTNPYRTVAVSAGLSYDSTWGYTFVFGGSRTPIPWADKLRVTVPPEAV